MATVNMEQWKLEMENCGRPIPLPHMELSGGLLHFGQTDTLGEARCEMWLSDDARVGAVATMTNEEGRR